MLRTAQLLSLSTTLFLTSCDRNEPTVSVKPEANKSFDQTSFSSKQSGLVNQFRPVINTFSAIQTIKEEELSKSLSNQAKLGIFLPALAKDLPSTFNPDRPTQADIKISANKLLDQGYILRIDYVGTDQQITFSLYKIDQEIEFLRPTVTELASVMGLAKVPKVFATTLLANSQNAPEYLGQTFPSKTDRFFMEISNFSNQPDSHWITKILINELAHLSLLQHDLSVTPEVSEAYSDYQTLKFLPAQKTAEFILDSLSSEVSRYRLSIEIGMAVYQRSLSFNPQFVSPSSPEQSDLALKAFISLPAEDLKFLALKIYRDRLVHEGIPEKRL